MSVRSASLMITSVTAILALSLSIQASRGDGTTQQVAAIDSQAASSGDTVSPDALAKMKALYKRPNEIPFPADNLYTPAKAQLGKTLFFDTRLSRVSVLACASCHNPSFGWEDGRPTAVGDNLQILRRNSPTVLNLAWAAAFFWDGRADSLEHQASGPIQAKGEMNEAMPDLLSRLNGIPGYQKMFEAAFPGKGISQDTITKAIATFERTVVSARSPFDDWIDGNEAAISDSAKRGFILFNGKGNCAACHSGWTLTDDSFHDIGLPDANGDKGRAEIVPDVPELVYAFKTPGLRNIDQRAPYMHDGSLATLEQVMQHYATGIVERPTLAPEIKKLSLNDHDVTDLVAFLKTLTGPDQPMSMPLLP